jgi:ABC-type polysaccharide/polyol phosphate export permease
MLNYQELLLQFTVTDFKLRYKNSVLGFVWVVLKPLVMFFITYTVWSALFKNTEPTYKMNLLLGLMFMNFLTDGMLVGLSSLISKAHIILKINFPREVVVMSATFTSVINFVVNMVVFVIFALFDHVTTSPQGILLFVISAFTVYVIIIGVSFFISVLYVRLRDLNQIVELVLQALFWATPILYPLEMLPESARQWILFNPLTPLVTAARKGLINGDLVNFSDFTTILFILATSLLFAFFGYRFFRRNVNKIAEYF